MTLRVEGDGGALIWQMLDDAIDDLPRYFAVADQPAGGVDGLDVNRPHMKCCVAVEDVRRMLRQRLASAAGQEQKP